MTIVDLPAAAEAIAEMDRLQRVALGPNASVGDVQRAVVRRQEVEALLEKFVELEAESGQKTRQIFELNAKVRELTDDPLLDATDGAHPAWWRGHDHTAKKFEESIDRTWELLGDTYGGSGTMLHEAVGRCVRRVAELKADYERVAGMLGRKIVEIVELKEAKKVYEDHCNRGATIVSFLIERSDCNFADVKVYTVNATDLKELEKWGRDLSEIDKRFLQEQPLRRRRRDEVCPVCDAGLDLPCESAPDVIAAEYHLVPSEKG